MTPDLGGKLFQNLFYDMNLTPARPPRAFSFFCDLKFKSLLPVMAGDSQNLSFEVRGLCFQAKNVRFQKITISSKSQVFRSIQDSHGYFAVLERLFPPTCSFFNCLSSLLNHQPQSKLCYL